MPADPHPGDEPGDVEAGAGWLTAVVVAAVVVLVVTPAAVLTLPVGLVLAVALVRAGPVYGALAVVAIVFVRLRSRRPQVPDPVARRFRTARQRLHLTFLVGTAITFVPGVVVVVQDGPATRLPSELFWFAPAIGPAVALLVTDWWWAMSPRIAAAERETLRDRSPGHVLVRVNRLLSWPVWLLGIVVGALFWGQVP